MCLRLITGFSVFGDTRRRELPRASNASVTSDLRSATLVPTDRKKYGYVGSYAKDMACT